MKESSIYREKMQSLEKKASEHAVMSRTTLVGRNMILNQESKKTKDRKVLEKTFGESDTSKIMALAYYVVCRGKALLACRYGSRNLREAWPMWR